jgi:hypothetical protein
MMIAAAEIQASRRTFREPEFSDGLFISSLISYRYRAVGK